MYAERDSTGRMKLLLDASYGSRERVRDKINKEKRTHMTVNWRVSQCVRSPLRLSVRKLQSLDGWSF